MEIGSSRAAPFSPRLTSMTLPRFHDRAGLVTASGCLLWAIVLALPSSAHASCGHYVFATGAGLTEMGLPGSVLDGSVGAGRSQPGSLQVRIGERRVSYSTKTPGRERSPCPGGICRREGLPAPMSPSVPTVSLPQGILASVPSFGREAASGGFAETSFRVRRLASGNIFRPPRFL